jgi:hypothetical protein
VIQSFSTAGREHLLAAVDAIAGLGDDVTMKAASDLAKNLRGGILAWRKKRWRWQNSNARARSSRPTTMAFSSWTAFCGRRRSAADGELQKISQNTASKHPRCNRLLDASSPAPHLLPPPPRLARKRGNNSYHLCIVAQPQALLME